MVFPTLDPSSPDGGAEIPSEWAADTPSGRPGAAAAAARQPSLAALFPGSSPTKRAPGRAATQAIDSGLGAAVPPEWAEDLRRSSMGEPADLRRRASDASEELDRARAREEASAAARAGAGAGGSRRRASTSVGFFRYSVELTYARAGSTDPTASTSGLALAVEDGRDVVVVGFRKGSGGATLPPEDTGEISLGDRLLCLNGVVVRGMDQARLEHLVEGTVRNCALRKNPVIFERAAGDA